MGTLRIPVSLPACQKSDAPNQKRCRPSSPYRRAATRPLRRSFGIGPPNSAYPSGRSLPGCENRGRRSTRPFAATAVSIRSSFSIGARPSKSTIRSHSSIPSVAVESPCSTPAGMTLMAFAAKLAASFREYSLLRIWQQGPSTNQRTGKCA